MFESIALGGGVAAPIMPALPSQTAVGWDREGGGPFESVAPGGGVAAPIMLLPSQTAVGW